MAVEVEVKVETSGNSDVDSWESRCWVDLGSMLQTGLMTLAPLLGPRRRAGATTWVGRVIGWGCRSWVTSMEVSLEFVHMIEFVVFLPHVFAGVVAFPSDQVL